MRREVEIINKLGLHARPASEFVRCVIRFKSTITICKGEESFSAASILEVLSADLDCGARVVLEAVGPDEQEALNRLEALLLRFRDEEGGIELIDCNRHFRKTDPCTRPARHLLRGRQAEREGDEIPALCATVDRHGGFIRSEGSNPRL